MAVHAISKGLRYEHNKDISIILFPSWTIATELLYFISDAKLKAASAEANHKVQIALPSNS